MRVFSLLICLIAATLWSAMALAAEPDWAALRQQMVIEEIEAAGVSHAGVLRAMRSTPRHEFVLRGFQQQAYFDAALPIGEEQTISPPYVVAYMTQLLDPQPADKVLEIGTGSGYQAAVLSPLVAEVYTIEIVERLGRRAERTLRRLGYDNVQVRVGDGYQGWPEAAPFDKIIVTCSPEAIPQPLVDQLKEGGCMIVPVGQRYQQNLYRVTKRDGQLEREPLQATLFVPMTGTAEAKREVLPDPTRPTLTNGDFAETLPGTQLPVGWHYLRGARVEGETYWLTFENDEPGQPSRALQGLALDGRKVVQLELVARVRGQNLSEGPTLDQRPAVIITFYDERRAVIGHERLANWQGSFPWQMETRAIDVPLATREVIVRVGLLGGVGRLEIDDISLSPR